MFAKKRYHFFYICLLSILSLFIFISCISPTGLTINTTLREGKSFSLSSTDTLALIAVQPLESGYDNLYLLYEGTSTVSGRPVRAEEQLQGLYVLESKYGSYSEAATQLTTTLENSDRFIFFNDNICFMKGSTIGACDLNGTVIWENNLTTEGKTVLSIGKVVQNNENHLAVMTVQNNTHTCLILNPENGEASSQEQFGNLTDENIIFGPFTMFDQILVLLENKILKKDGVFISLELTEGESVVAVYETDKAQLALITRCSEQLYEMIFNETGECLSREAFSASGTSARKVKREGANPDIPVSESGNATYPTSGNKIQQIASSEKQKQDEFEKLQIAFAEQPPSEVEADEMAIVKIETNQPVAVFCTSAYTDNGEFFESDIPAFIDSNNPVKVNGKYIYTIGVPLAENGKINKVSIACLNSLHPNNNLGLNESYLPNQSNALKFEVTVKPLESEPVIETEEEIPELTTEATLNIKILADQVLKQLNIKNNGILNNIPDPQGEIVQTPDGKTLHRYDTFVGTTDGQNAIEIQGSNDNGDSNKITATVEKGELPIIEFAEPPPSVVYCTENEDHCDVTIKIRGQNCNKVSYFISSVDGGNGMANYENGIFTINVRIPKNDEAAIFMVGINDFGESEQIQCVINCSCQDKNKYTLKNIIGTDSIKSPIDLIKTSKTGKKVIAFGKNNSGDKRIYEINDDHTMTLTGLKVARDTTALKSDYMNSEFFEQLDYYIERLTSANAYNGIIPNLQGYQSVPGQLKYESSRIRNLVQKTDDATDKKIEGHYPGETNDSAPEYQCVDVPGETKSFTEINYSGNSLHEQLITVDKDNFVKAIKMLLLSPERVDGRTSELLFTMPATLGEAVDISMHELDATTTNFMITSVTEAEEYFVSIFQSDGTLISSFQIDQTGETSDYADDTLFFKAFLYREAEIVGEEVVWTYGDIYVINNRYPGIQVWSTSE